MLDPTVLRTKSALMQRVADLARMHPVYVTGTVPLDRAPSLVLKFRDLYMTNLSKDARYRRKRRGLGNAHLVLWQPNLDAPLIFFVLLVSATGEHAARKLEDLRSVYERHARLTVTDDYELVRHCRGGACPTTSISWQMTEAREQRWRNDFRDAIRHGAYRDIAALWQSLHLVPGFARIRVQAKIIKKFAKAEYERSRSGPFPAPRTRLGYIRRIPHTGLPLSAVIRRAGRAS